jgi:outer membrane protease
MHTNVIERSRVVRGILGLWLWAAPAVLWAMHATEAIPLVEEDTPTGILLRGSVGYLQGEALETVYFRNHKVSELDWDLSEVIMGGGVVSAGFNRWVRVNAGLWWTLTEGNGGMDDYDYRLVGGPWTDWSHSEVDVTDGYILDVNLSVAIPIQQWPVVSHVVLGYRRDVWKWSDHAYDFVYSSDPPDLFRDYRGSYDGANAVDYQQQFDIPYAGLGLSGYWRPFSVCGYVFYSPFASAEDEDYHVLRDQNFRESFRGGDYWGVNLQAAVEFARWFYFAVALDAQGIPESRGDMETTDDHGKPVTVSNGGGIANNAAMVSLSLGGKF